MKNNNVNMNAFKAAPIFGFELILRRRGYFYISEKSLQEIRYGTINGKMVFAPKQVAFERLLEVEGLEVKKVDDELSVIKKK